MIRNDLNGIVRLNFTINSAGSVSEVKILNSDVDSSILENCIINVIKGMSFPEAKNKMPTTVVYPFVFKRSS
jgi:TonB family protein